MHHELKILPSYFEAVTDGRKTFEIRRDDRGFKAGDSVLLREYDPESGPRCKTEAQCYTGRQHLAKIGYVTDYGQKQGCVVFSLLAMP